MNLVPSVLRREWFLGSAILLILVGCGRKGPPIPYDVTVPKAISDLEGMVREGKVFLRWSIPRKAADGSRPEEPREFRVLREEALLGGEWCEECPERLERFDVLSMERKDNFSVVGDRVVYQDRRVSYGHVYVYRVVSVTARRYESPPSNRVVVSWDIPPPAPGRVEAAADDRAVNLGWDPVDRAEGYRIYRKQAGGEFGDVPIAVVGPKEFSYNDTGVSNDQAYAYVVRPIRRVGRTWLEGPGSQEIPVNPRDLRPPLPPQGLLAIPLADGIELSWQRNIDSDLLGYFVYRKDWEGGEYSRLNELPLEVPLYVDKTAVLGEVYRYVVTAVDSSPQKNESVFSESVRVVYVR